MEQQNTQDSFIIKNVPVIKQYPVLPTGCEATALTMLLQWKGLDVTKEAVANALVKEPNPFEEGGEWKGGHPNRAFVGDPYTEESFGVFNKPISETLEKFLPKQAEDITGELFEKILERIREGIPVVIWISIELRELKVVQSWKDIKGTGEEIVWKSPEHAVLLIGFNKEKAIVNDPHTGGTEYYDLPTLKSRWEELGRMAVTIRRE